MLGYSHVGAGGDDVIVGCLLGEVFERGQRERTFLYLVKEEQCSAGEYPVGWRRVRADGLFVAGQDPARISRIGMAAA